VIGDPPLLTGAVQLTVAEVLPPVAVPIVGAPGATAGGAGITVFEVAESAPTPLALTACTAKLYEVPLVRPVPTELVALAGMPVMVLTTVVPLRTTISKLVIGEVPALAGAAKVTVAVVFPAVAVPMVGADGAPAIEESENCNTSTWRSVSMPSLIFWPTTLAPVWVTVVVFPTTVTL
jgi:hypothetical protein